MDTIKMESLLPFIEEAFNRDKTFKIPITGTSMNPLLYQGRDFVFIKKASLPLEIGDVPLYRRDSGEVVLHRIVGKDSCGYVLLGDNQFVTEHGIQDRHIIGVMDSMLIDGKMVYVSDEEYIKHKNKYVKNASRRKPLHRLKYKILCRLRNGK